LNVLDGFADVKEAEKRRPDPIVMDIGLLRMDCRGGAAERPGWSAAGKPTGEKGGRMLLRSGSK
jgi:hypothetical protein